MKYSINNLVTFPVATAQLATGKRVHPFSRQQAWIDYAGRRERSRMVSFGRLLGQGPGRASSSGKIVVVGADRPRPAGHPPHLDRPAMPGAEIQANAIDTVLRGFPLGSARLGRRGPDRAARRVAPARRPARRPIGSIAIAVGHRARGRVRGAAAFNAGTIVSFVYPLLALVLSRRRLARRAARDRGVRAHPRPRPVRALRARGRRRRGAGQRRRACGSAASSARAR